MMMIRFQGIWMIWVLFTNVGETDGRARVEGGGYCPEFEASGGASGGDPRGLVVERKKGHLSHWLSQKSKEVSIPSRSL